MSFMDGPFLPHRVARPISSSHRVVVPKQSPNMKERPPVSRQAGWQFNGIDKMPAILPNSWPKITVKRSPLITVYHVSFPKLTFGSIFSRFSRLLNPQNSGRPRSSALYSIQRSIGAFRNSVIESGPRRAVHVVRNVPNLQSADAAARVD